MLPTTIDKNNEKFDWVEEGSFECNVNCEVLGAVDTDITGFGRTVNTEGRGCGVLETGNTVGCRLEFVRLVVVGCKVGDIVAAGMGRELGLMAGCNETGNTVGCRLEFVRLVVTGCRVGDIVAAEMGRELGLIAGCNETGNTVGCRLEFVRWVVVGCKVADIVAAEMGRALGFIAGCNVTAYGSSIVGMEDVSGV